ncbi:unnamed protein product [Macrosiphum euphorbiae]|uniref:Uncharacterized protein n=1 Tax=Macrosiphum euphorbiae TaxID=13131 RepID=A0AAV0W785_9HEMI|nr:unnamed protein product [Macrosiphum euphorbiae]
MAERIGLRLIRLVATASRMVDFRRASYRLWELFRGQRDLLQRLIRPRLLYFDNDESTAGVVIGCQAYVLRFINLLSGRHPFFRSMTR